MNVQQFRETFSPWFDVVTKRFQDSFSEDYDIHILAFLHENIDREIKLVFSSTDKHYSAIRTQALYNVLTYLYEHILWKLRKKDYPNANLSCVKLLSQLIKTGLLLTQGLSEGEYIDRILTALKLFEGNPALLYDALLLVNGLKRVHHKPYSAILRCVLKADYKDITDPLLYMEVILLFRRLRALSDSSNKTLYSFATKMKPPSNLISWLVSLNVNGSISFLKLLKHKSIVQQLMRKSIPESLLKTIRHMILKSYYFEDNCDTYRQMAVSKKPSNLFITDTSSLLMCENQSVHSSNKLNLKKVNSKKQGKQRKKQNKDSDSVKKIDLSSEKTKKSTALKSYDSQVFYVNNYSNLVVENGQSESLYESDGNELCISSNSVAGTSKIISADCREHKKSSKKKQKSENEQSESLHESDGNELCISSNSVAGNSKIISADCREHKKSSKKKRKSKLAHDSSIQIVELENNCEVEIVNVSDSDSLDKVTDVPSKKFKKDYMGEQASHSCISSKRNHTENEGFENNIEIDTANAKRRKKNKYDMDSKILNEYNSNLENCNISVGSNLGDMNITSEKEVENTSKKNFDKSDKSSLEDEVSFIAEVTRNKTGKDLLERSKTGEQKSMKSLETLSKEAGSKKRGNVVESKDSSRKNKSCDLKSPSVKNNIPLAQMSSLRPSSDAANSKVSFNQKYPELVKFTESEDALHRRSEREDMLEMASKHCSNQQVISGYTDMTANREQSTINSLDKINEVASHSLLSSNTSGSTAETSVEKEAEINSLVSTENVSKVKSLQLLSESSTESSVKETSREDILSVVTEHNTESVESKISEHETAQNGSTDESILSHIESDRQNDDSSKIGVECSESVNPSHHLQKAAEILTNAESRCTQISGKESGISPKYSITDEMCKVDLSSQNCTVIDDTALKASPQKKNELSENNSKCSFSSEVNDFTVKAALQLDVLNDKSHCAGTVSAAGKTEKQSLQKYSVDVIEKVDVPSSSNASNNVIKGVISTVKDDKSNHDLSTNNNISNSVSKPSVKSNLGAKNAKIIPNEADMPSSVNSDLVSLDASKDKTIKLDDSLTVSDNNHCVGNTSKKPLNSEHEVNKINKCAEDSVKNLSTEKYEPESKDGVSDIETISSVCCTVDKSTEKEHMDVENTYESSDVLQEREEDIIQGVSFEKDVSSPDDTLSFSSKCKDLEESISTTNCLSTNKNSESFSQYVDRVPQSQNVLLDCGNVTNESCNTQSPKKYVSETADSRGVSSKSSEILDSNKRDLDNLSNDVTNEMILDTDMKCEASQIDIKESAKDSTAINVESEVKFSENSKVDYEEEMEKQLPSESTTVYCDNLVSSTSDKRYEKALEKITFTSNTTLQEVKCCSQDNTKQLMLGESQNHEILENVSSELVGNLPQDNINPKISHKNDEGAESLSHCDTNTDTQSQNDVKSVDLLQSYAKPCSLLQNDTQSEIIHQDVAKEESSTPNDKKIDSLSHDDAKTESVLQEDAESESISQNDTEMVSLSQDDAKYKNTLQKDAEAESVSQNDTIIVALPQDNVNSEDICQIDAKTESASQCDTKAYSVSQDDAQSKIIHQDDVKEESSFPNDKKMDSLSDDSKPESVLQEDAESESTSQNDTEMVSLSQDDAKYKNTIKKDADAESVSQNHTNVVVRPQDNGNSEDICQIDAQTESASQCHTKTDSLSQECPVSNVKDKTVIKDNLNGSSHSVLITHGTCDIDISCNVSKNTVYPSPKKDRIHMFTSDADLEEIDVVNVDIDSKSESSIAKNEYAADSVNVIKDLPSADKDKNISKPIRDKKFCTQSIKKIPLQSTEEKALSSEYIPYFCKNKDYVSFSDISLRNKDRNIVVDSGLKSPNSIANFSLAATAEIFCEYRNGVLCEEKADTLSRDDVSSNMHELSDFIKSPSLSSSASEEDCDSQHYSSAEDPLMDEVEKVSDQCPDKISLETTKSSALLKNSEGCPDHTIEADDKSNSSLPNENDSLNEFIPDKKEPNESVLLRQSLRLRNKADVTNKVKLDENPETYESSEKESKSGTEVTDDVSCQISSPKSDGFSCHDLISSSTSSDKNVTDIPPTSEGKLPSQKSVSRKNVSGTKSKSKLKAKDYISPPKGYSLRHRKSRKIVDDSSNLGIDLTKLQLDSPSCSRNTRSRSTKDVKFAKLLSSGVDIGKHSDSGDLTLFTKRETRSSCSKTEEATQNTAGYGLRTRKSIIAPGKLKI